MEIFRELPSAPGYLAANGPTTPAPSSKLTAYSSPLTILTPAIVIVAVAVAVVPPPAGAATVIVGADE